MSFFFIRLFTCRGLQYIETSKQRINVESITNSLAGSPHRDNVEHDDDVLSSLAKLTNKVGTLRRINCSHFEKQN